MKNLLLSPQELCLNLFLIVSNRRSILYSNKTYKLLSVKANQMATSVLVVHLNQPGHLEKQTK